MSALLCGSSRVSSYFPSQIIEFLARDQAYLFEKNQVCLCLGEFARHEKCNTHVHMRVAMAGVELQRAMKVFEGQIEVAGASMGKTEVVLDIRIARVSQGRRGEPAYGRAPVFGFDRLLARYVVGVEPKCGVIRVCQPSRTANGVCDDVDVGRGRIFLVGVNHHREREEAKGQTEQRGRVLLDHRDPTRSEPSAPMQGCCHYLCASACFISRSSGRSPSPLRVRRASLR